ncbi:MAG TPA: type II secretion system F family protein [Nocardioidaceae bacterium]|nr:type II secretion system F family protein [Nocardioidaceae bacterium]
MTAWGAVLGALIGVSLLLVLERARAARRPRLELRVLPYIRDLPMGSRRRPEPHSDRPRSAFTEVFGPAISSLARRLDRVLGGTSSIRRRLERANLPLSVHDFRVEQVVWGLVCFGVTAAGSVLVALRTPGRAVPLLVLCGIAFVFGALWRENRLTAQVKAREQRMLAEFPTVAELLALAVAAGEGPVSAMDRVVTRAHGELSRELAGVLAEVRTGTQVTTSLDALAARTGLPVVARFAEAMAVALERGTPLTEVMHAQAADVREAGRRALIESGARREVLMMVPVVFLVLPVTVLFAFWPGVVGLRLVTP